MDFIQRTGYMTSNGLFQCQCGRVEKVYEVFFQIYLHSSVAMC